MAGLLLAVALMMAAPQQAAVRSTAEWDSYFARRDVCDQLAKSAQALRAVNASLTAVSTKTDTKAVELFDVRDRAAPGTGERHAAEAEGNDLRIVAKSLNEAMERSERQAFGDELFVKDLCQRPSRLANPPDTLHAPR